MEMIRMSGLPRPGIALQSFGTSWGVFGGWLLGSAAGAYAGVAAGIRARALIGAG
jgi:hypothetical protein